jgi:thiamine-phosphate pyrophosphorylase
MDRLRAALRLYVATDRALAGDRDLVAIIAAALRGGATAVQLRDKQASARETLALGRALQPIIRTAGALFIVNDRPDLALALEADGVHLGQDDLPVAVARRILGADAIIGVSTNSPDEARRAEAEGAAYVGAGPAYPTTTRANPRALLGPARITLIRQATTLPLVAIGGITAPRAPALRAAGADGICAIGAVIGASDPECAVRELRATFNLPATTASRRRYEHRFPTSHR